MEELSQQHERYLVLIYLTAEQRGRHGIWYVYSAKRVNAQEQGEIAVSGRFEISSGHLSIVPVGELVLSGLRSGR
jgi:hypothetical protein